MELGGNAALLVFDDADLDRAIAGAMAMTDSSSARVRPGSSSPASIKAPMRARTTVRAGRRSLGTISSGTGEEMVLDLDAVR